jgi:oligoribonuclease
MPRTSPKSHRLVWLDLEMTGLDPDSCVVVEIATIVTDAELNVVAEGPDLVIHATDEQLAAMAPVVQEMHARSGLTPEIRASELTVADAEEQTLAFIREHCPKKGQHPLCGNSIGTDRRFLARHMPQIEEHLSYRSVDVSTIKELARRWYPKRYRDRPRKAEGHRALADIRESIEELRYWRSSVFVPPPE